MIIQARANYHIIEQLESIQSTVSYLNQYGCPDLIFMDIQLGDGLSFSIFKQVEIRINKVNQQTQKKNQSV